MRNMNQERIQREKDFHNVRFEKETRDSLDKYYSVSQLIDNYYYGKLFKEIENKVVLEYGCGLGNHSFELAEYAKEVYSIDISDVAIEKAKELAKQKGINNIHFIVMNAEVLNFPNNYFDVVCGTSIIHHLDLEASYSELSRVLKKSGKAYFIEPLGHNPLINLFRKFTSNLRTEDEHPLRTKDINKLNNHFHIINIRYYYLLSLLAIPFRSQKYFSKLLYKLNSIDQFLFHFGLIKKQAWQVVLEIENPRK